MAQDRKRALGEDARQITEADFLDTHRRTKFAPTDVMITNSGTIDQRASSDSVT